MTTQTAAAGQKSTYGLQELTLKAIFTVIFAVLMAVSANAFLYLPFTPVPITLQVLTVIFSALMLGGPWAFTSQVLYISMGLAGLPVFAGFIGGSAALLGPTGGYIIGFAFSAYITGFFASGRSLDFMTRGNKYVTALISSILGLLVIYTMGGLHLFGFLLGLSSGRYLMETARSVWVMGIRPFIILDLAKILVAIIILRPGITGYEDNKNK